MEKKVIYILVIAILVIVIFINFNNDKFIHIWNLIYYSQYYIIVGLLIWFIWVLFSNKNIRLLTIPIGIYYAFHLVVNTIEIFSPELKDQLYTTKTINYILAISMGLAVFIPFIYEKLRRFINQRKSK